MSVSIESLPKNVLAIVFKHIINQTEWLMCPICHRPTNTILASEQAMFLQLVCKNWKISFKKQYILSAFNAPRLFWCVVPFTHANEYLGELRDMYGVSPNLPKMYAVGLTGRDEN